MTSSDVASRPRVPAWLVPLAAGLVAFGWLAWPGADPHVALFNMDALYHVHRISRCLQDFPWVSSLDTYSHAGTPWHLHWPGPHALLYAVVAKIAGVPAGDILALTKLLSWIPPLLGALAAAATVVLGRALGLSETWSALAGFACALSGDAMVAFHHGEIDHHAFAALCLPVLVIAFVRRNPAAWIVALVLLFATTPEATPYVTLLLAAAAACEGLGAARADGPLMPRPWLFFLAPAGAAFVAWMMDRGLDPDAPSLFELSPFRLSAFQTGWLLAIGAAAAAGASLPRRGRTAGERWLVLGGVALGVVSMLLLALLWMGALAEIIDRLAQAQRQQVGEELPLYRFLMHATATHWGAWAALLALVALAACARMLVALQRGVIPTALLAAVLPAGAVLLGMIELRHARSLAPFACVALVVAARDALAGLALARPFATRAGTVVAAAWLALIALPPFAWHAAELRTALRREATWPATIGALCDWTRTGLPDAGPRNRRPERAVFGPWEWGHHLNVLGGQPVVVDGFNHEEDTNRASWDVWLAETGDGFADAARSHGATHVVITGAPGSILGLLRRTSYEVVRRAPDVPGGALYLPALRRHAAFRLDEGGGIVDEAGRLMPLWASETSRPLAVLDGERVRIVDVPAARLFEIVPGTEVSGIAPPGAAVVTVLLRYRIGTAGQVVTITRMVPADGSGAFKFRTAIPAPWRSGTLVIPEPYRVVTPVGDAMIILSENAVRLGVPTQISPTAFAPAATAGAPGMP